MSGPGIVETIAETLAGHCEVRFDGDGSTICAGCSEYMSRPVGTISEDIRALSAHQARAVLAALTEAGTVEWSVATRDGITPAIAMSEPAARRASAVHGRKLVSRLTLPWTKAVE